MEIPFHLIPLLQETIGIQNNAAYNDFKRSEEMLRPCMMIRPNLTKHVYFWAAEYGDICAIGDTPEEAYLKFDKTWKGEQ